MGEPRRVARRAALTLCTVATAFFAVMVVGHAVGPDEPTLEGAAVGGAALMRAAATLLGAWLKARFAWAALLIAAACFATVIALTAVRNILIVAVLLPAPWRLAGLLLPVGPAPETVNGPPGAR